MNSVIYENVFIKLLPTEGATLHTQFDGFEKILRCVRQQGITRGRKADEALIVKFQPDAAPLHPAADANGGAVLNRSLSGHHGMKYRLEEGIAMLFREELNLWNVMVFRCALKAFAPS